MQWEFMIALVLAIPIILFPVAFLWYLNIGGIYAAIREARKRRVAREQRARAVVEELPAVTGAAAQERPAGRGLAGPGHRDR